MIDQRFGKTEEAFSRNLYLVLNSGLTRIVIMYNKRCPEVAILGLQNSNACLQTWSVGRKLWQSC